MRALIPVALATALCPALSARASVETSKDLEAAKVALAAADAQLDAAISKAKEKAPTEEALNKAQAAVDALRATLKLGARFEPKDLEYARAALAARKRLRLEGALIETRRKQAIFEFRQKAIDAQLSALEQSIEQISATSAKPDFDRAEQLALEVQTALKKAQPLAKEHAALRAYLKKTTAELQSQRQAIHLKRVAQTASQKRTEVEGAQKRFLDSAEALWGKAAEAITDAQFTQASAAGEHLAQLLKNARPLEVQNRDYGAFAAGVRKALVEKQSAIKKLWSTVALARLQAQLEPANRDLSAALSQLQKTPNSASLLAEARTATIVVDKLLEQYGPLANTPQLSRYIAQVRQTLVQSQVFLQKRKVDLQLAALNRSTLDQRDGALDALRDLLDQAKPLELQDRAYRSYANQQRQKLKRSRAQLAERRKSDAVRAQRKQLQQAQRALAKALNKLRRRNPKAADFQAAEDAREALRITLEGARPLARKDAKLSADVRKLRPRLRDAKKTIKQRKRESTIDQQRARVKKSMQALQRRVNRLPRRASTDEATKLAKQLEEALAEGRKLPFDRGYRSFARDAKKVLKIARARIQTRIDELDTQERKAQVETALSALSTSISALKVSWTAKTYKSATEAHQRAEQALQQGEPLAKRVKKYARWAAKAQQRRAKLRERLRVLALEVEVNAQQEQVAAQAKKSVMAVQSALQETANSASIQSAKNALTELKNRIAKGVPLEEKSPDYLSFISQYRQTQTQLLEQLDDATHLITFRAGPLATLLEARQSAEKFRAAKALKERKQLGEASIGLLSKCQKEAINILADHPRISKRAVRVDSAQVPTKALLKQCGAFKQKLKQELSGVLSSLAMYEGPVQSFTQGKTLMEQNERKKALGLFEECLSTGKILRHRHPELQKQSFEVAGEKMKLSTLISTCQKRARSLRDALSKK